MFAPAEITSALGYAPDPAYVLPFNLLIRLGFPLLLLGGLLWVALWVVQGFLPNGEAAPERVDGRLNR